MDATVRFYDHVAGVLKSTLHFVESIPVMRVIYSLVLLAVIFAAGRELISVWTRGRLFLAEFSYFIDGKKNAERGEQLRDETIRVYRMIIALMKIESENTKITSDDEVPSEGTDKEAQSPLLENLLINKVDQLSQVEITFQGVSIKAFLSAVSSFVSPQNTEIGAAIFADQQRRAFISVTGTTAERRQLGIFERLPPEYAIDSGGSDAETAFRIACFLVWIQWDKTEDTKAPDPENGISFDEFCDWARILVIKNKLRLTDPYRLQEEVKNVNLDLVKKQFSLAANLKIGYQAAYASLYSLVSYVGSETVDLGDGVRTDINSLADILRFFSLMENDSRDRDEKAVDWVAFRTRRIEAGQVINRAYFAPAMSTDCDGLDRVPTNVRASISNVVRIVQTRKIGGRLVPLALSTMTGLVYADGAVLTTFFWPSDAASSRLDEIFSGATVRLVRCGAMTASFKVEAARFLDKAGNLPFVTLKVPGLKLQAGAPSFDFDDVGFSECWVIGHIRDTDLLFADRRKLRTLDKGETNNEVTQVLSGKALQAYGDASTQRRLIGVPFANGLRGNPVFNEQGDVVGMVESGRYIGTNLGLPVAASVVRLKRSLAAAAKSSAVP